MVRRAAKHSGEALQPAFQKEIIDIIIAVIIYLSAFALLTKTIISKYIRLDKSNVNAEPTPVVPPIKEPTPPDIVPGNPSESGGEKA